MGSYLYYLSSNVFKLIILEIEIVSEYTILNDKAI